MLNCPLIIFKTENYIPQIQWHWNLQMSYDIWLFLESHKETHILSDRLMKDQRHDSIQVHLGEPRINVIKEYKCKFP